MKILGSFSLSARIKLQDGVNPEDGFFYIQEVVFNDSLVLLSNFVSAAGDTSFWEEFVETSWDEEDKGVYGLSMTGDNIGLDIDDGKNDLEKLASLIESGDFEAKMGICFRRDGDDEGNLIEDYATFALDYFEARKVSEEEFQEFGYD